MLLLTNESIYNVSQHPCDLCQTAEEHSWRCMQLVSQTTTLLSASCM